MSVLQAYIERTWVLKNEGLDHITNEKLPKKKQDSVQMEEKHGINRGEAKWNLPYLSAKMGTLAYMFMFILPLSEYVLSNVHMCMSVSAYPFHFPFFLFIVLNRILAVAKFDIYRTGCKMLTSSFGSVSDVLSFEKVLFQELFPLLRTKEIVTMY